ncbi:MAG: hypothetical protein FWG24_03970 [Eggerthellaceae bacterium]|nr:hypothetical protein [Eggerthellaceae bacterium]
MNIRELKQLLEESNVSKNIYAIYSDDYVFGECYEYIRVLDNGMFEVCNVDRGERFDIRRFVSEHDACMYFLEDGYFPQLKEAEDVKAYA